MDPSIYKSKYETYNITILKNFPRSKNCAIILYNKKNSPRKKCAEYLNVLRISVRPAIILGIPEEKIFLIGAPDVEVQIPEYNMKAS
jgi:hypothetical protein